MEDYKKSMDDFLTEADDEGAGEIPLETFE
jgi:hypothetical protein